MTTTAKPKTANAPAKASAAKEITPKATPVKTESKKDVAEGYVKVTQLVGTIARRHDQEATLIGLGLNKRHRSKVLENTPSVRGMIYKVRHLVKVEKA